jgi:hypothetical protein
MPVIPALQGQMGLHSETLSKTKNESGVAQGAFRYGRWTSDVVVKGGQK